MTTHVYVSGKQTAGFYCLVPVAEGDVRTLRCVKSQFITEDDKYAEAIDNLIAKTGIGRHLRKVDAAKAEAEFLANRSPASAQQGSATAAQLRETMLGEIARKDKEMMQAALENEKLSDQLAADGLLVTTPVDPVVATPVATPASAAVVNLGKKK